MTTLHQLHPLASDERTTAVTPVVRSFGLGRAVDDRVILDDVNLAVAPGQCVALLGANGAGKTTLMQVLATLTRPTSGELELFGEPVDSGAAAVRAFRGRIGMIGHQPMIYRELSALENLVFFGTLYGLAKPRERALELLERVDLADRAGDAAKTFSRGMVQRLSIARALMHNPDLLLADEPFAGLDVPSTRTVEAFLAQMHREGRTVILSNHDVSQSLRLTQRVIVLRRGRVVLEQPSASVDVDEVTREVIAP